MRVLLCLHHYLDPNLGAPGATLSLGSALVDAGCEVEYFAWDQAFPKPRSEIVMATQFPWKLAKYLERNGHKFDIIDASTGDSWVWDKLGRPGHKKEHVLATRSHGLEQTVDRNLRTARGGKVGLKYRLYHGGYRLWEVAESMKQADQLFLLNDEDRSVAIDQLGISPERIAVLPNGINDAFHNQPKPSANSGPISLAFAGAWLERKGKNVVVHALTDLQKAGLDFEITLYGTIQDEAAVLSDFTAAVQSRITVIPRYANAELPKMLARHEIFLFPSRSEGFGLALIEAMACGLAPISTPVGIAPTAIVNGVNGLIAPIDDAPAFAAAVLDLAKSRESLLQMRGAAQEKSKEFSWDKIAYQTIHTYEQALARKYRAAKSPDGKMKIYFVSPALPPKLDGIGDYTSHLAKEISKTHDVGILTAQIDPTPIDNVDIQTCFNIAKQSTFWNLLDIAKAQKPDWIILQYNAFSYGRWGKNLVLPLVFRAIKKRCPQTKLALMMHEPYVPILNFRTAIMTTWQRWQLWSLGRTADLACFSIEPWQKKFRRWFPNTPTVHLPVGSNVPFLGVSRDEARKRLGIADETIVLGLFGQAHDARLLDWPQASAERVKQSGRDVVLLYIGPQADRVKSAISGIDVISTGRLSEDEVSRTLPAMDIYLSAFVDGISTRRSSMMVALAHGLATVGTYAYNTDRILHEANGKSLVLVPASSRDAFAQAVADLASNPNKRAKLGSAVREFYTDNFEWDRIGKKLIDSLGQKSVAVTPPAHAGRERNPCAPRAKRVLYLCPVGEKGGAEVVLSDIALRLDRSRYTPLLVCLKPGPFVTEMRDTGIKAYAFESHKARELHKVAKAIIQLRRILKRERIDLVHANGGSMLFYAGLASVWLNIPIVWHVHDPLKGHGIFERGFVATQRRLKPSFTVFNTQVTADSFKATYHHLTDSKIVFPGVDTKNVASGDPNAARERYSIEPSAPVIAMFARLQKVKGHFYLIEAAKEIVKTHPDCRFIVCGGSLFGREPDYPDELAGAIERANLQDRFIMTGFVPDTERRDILAAADIVVHPADSEPFGLALIEGMAAGKPVVAADAVGPSTIVIDQTTGLLFPKGDVQALTEALLRLIDDKSLRKKMGDSGRENVRQNYDIGVMVSKIESIYEQIA